MATHLIECLQISIDIWLPVKVFFLFQTIISTNFVKTRYSKLQYLLQIVISTIFFQKEIK